MDREEAGRWWSGTGRWCTLQYWYIPIGSEDTAGPGHWLEQLPE